MYIILLQSFFPNIYFMLAFFHSFPFYCIFCMPSSCDYSFCIFDPLLATYRQVFWSPAVLVVAKLFVIGLTFIVIVISLLMAPKRMKFREMTRCPGQSSSSKKQDSDENESYNGDMKTVESKAQCRICHEEDIISKLEAPCACRGTIMYVHRSCMLRWVWNRGLNTCEICKEIYGQNYNAPPSDAGDAEDSPPRPSVIYAIWGENGVRNLVATSFPLPPLPVQQQLLPRELWDDDYIHPRNLQRTTPKCIIWTFFLFGIGYVLLSATYKWLEQEGSYNPNSWIDVMVYYATIYIYPFHVIYWLTGIVIIRVKVYKIGKRRRLAMAEVVRRLRGGRGLVDEDEENNPQDQDPDPDHEG